MTMFRKVFTDRMSTESAEHLDGTAISSVEHPAPLTHSDHPVDAHGRPTVPTTQTPPEQPPGPALHDRIAAPPMIPPTPKPPVAPPPNLAAGVHPDAGHPRTRLLGFAPGGVEDPIETAAKNASNDLFPAGWLAVIAGPGVGHHFAISGGVTTIGRGADQGICLDFGDTSISRSNHASVAYDTVDNTCYLGHGGKSNIIRLNDKPVLSTEILTHGDTVRIGETVLRFASLCGPDFSWDAATDV